MGPSIPLSFWSTIFRSVSVGGVVVPAVSSEVSVAGLKSLFVCLSEGTGMLDDAEIERSRKDFSSFGVGGDELGAFPDLRSLMLSPVTGGSFPDRFFLFFLGVKVPFKTKASELVGDPVQQYPD
jgi:hypothetical protein